MKYGIANTNDIPALIEMRVQYLIEEHGKLAQDELILITKNLRDYFHKHLNKDILVFICRDVDTIVSCCFLCITEKPANLDFINGKIGTILNVYTRPAYRNIGIAGRLLNMLLAEAAKIGLDFVELKATDSGYKLYKSLGFEDIISKYHNMKYVINPNNKS